MKSMPTSLLAEQCAPSTTPAVKFTVHEFGHPEASIGVRVGDFDWKDSILPFGVMAGLNNESFLVIVNGKIRKYADPTVDSYVEYNIPTGKDSTLDDVWFPGYDVTAPCVVCGPACMIGHPTTGEVLMFSVVYYPALENSIQWDYSNPIIWSWPGIAVSVSSDYGETWSDWTMFTDPASEYQDLINNRQIFSGGVSIGDLTATYNDSGDVCVCAYTVVTCQLSQADGYRFFKRSNGVWSAKPVAGTGSAGMNNVLGIDPDESPESGPSWYFTNSSLTWDEDYILILTAERNEVYGRTGVGTAFVILGDGGYYPLNKIYEPGGVRKSNDSETVYRFMDFSTVSIDATSRRTLDTLLSLTNDGSLGAFPALSRLRRNLTEGATASYFNTILGENTMAHYQDTQPYSYIHRDYSGRMIFSYHTAGRAEFMIRRPDYPTCDGLFYAAGGIKSKWPYQLYSTPTYLIAANKEDRKIAYVGEWAIPTAGAGMGETNYEIPFDRVVSVDEDTKSHDASSLVITLDNSDGIYDSPRADTKALIESGNIIRMYMGYEIDGTDTQVEYQRYFINNISYLRERNRSLLQIQATDGWGLLEAYCFNMDAWWNRWEDDSGVNLIQNPTFSSQVVTTDTNLMWYLVIFGITRQCPSYVGAPNQWYKRGDGSFWSTIFPTAWITSQYWNGESYTIVSPYPHPDVPFSPWLQQCWLILQRKGADCFAYQSVVMPDTYREAVVTIKADVWASNSGAAKITIYDGVESSSSVYHSGNASWENLSVSKTIHKSATELTIKLEVANSDAVVYFKNTSMVSTSRKEFGGTTDYEMIEDLVACIGGTLTYESRSSEVMQSYHKLEAKAGENAATLLKNLLAVIPDCIKFFGVDAVLYTPKDTDSPVYYYQGPTPN